MDAGFLDILALTAPVSEAPRPLHHEVWQNGYGNERNEGNEPFFLQLTAPVQLENLTLIANKVEQLLTLQTNWDGYGAKALSQQVISNCLKFVESLPEFVQERLDLDDITPTSYGTIVADWRNESGEVISTEIGESTFGFFTEFNSPGEQLSIDRIDFNENALPLALFKAFNKLYKN
jgi:hypothetical protein